MSEILSQNEIDRLLQVIDGGNAQEMEIEDKKVVKEAKLYNFRRPSKFNKDHLKTLEIIFDNYARIVSSFLSGYLRTSTQIEVATAEQLTYSEFSNSLVNPVMLCIIDFNPLKGSIVLDISTDVGFSMIDRILGGPGIPIKKKRDFSEIELILLERLMEQMLNFLKEPWENVIELTPQLEKIETNSQFAQIISPNEMIALITLSIKIGSVEGFFSFCIPHLVLEPIMERINTKYWFTKRGKQEDTLYFKDTLAERLETAQIPVSAVIGKTNILIEDFLQLQKGDVIPLDSFITSDLNIMVGDLFKFKGKPGISRGKNAIQITSFVRKEDK